jgi:hypothetical protein
MPAIGGPASQPCVKIAATRSPFLSVLVPGPVSTTSPAPSESGTNGSFIIGAGLPLIIARSR